MASTLKISGQPAIWEPGSKLRSFPVNGLNQWKILIGFPLPKSFHQCLGVPIDDLLDPRRD